MRIFPKILISSFVSLLVTSAFAVMVYCGFFDALLSAEILSQWVPGKAGSLSSGELLLLASVFIIVFLVVFLILCLKQDRAEIIKGRIRTFQYRFLRDALSAGRLNTPGRIHDFCDELNFRRNEFNSRIKNNFSVGKRKKYSVQIDSLLESGWDEILAVLRKRCRDGVSSGCVNPAAVPAGRTFGAAFRNPGKMSHSKIKVEIEKFGIFEKPLRFRHKSVNGCFSAGEFIKPVVTVEGQSGAVTDGDGNFVSLHPGRETSPVAVEIPEESPSGSIVNRNGLYVIDSSLAETADTEGDVVDADFRKLVDSVLM